MSKKEPKESPTWNGFNYMEVKDYVGDEVRVHPFLPYDLDKMVIEGYIIELGVIVEKVVTQDDPLAISPEVESEVKALTDADIKQNGKLTKEVTDKINKIVKAERKRLYGHAISPACELEIADRLLRSRLQTLTGVRHFFSAASIPTGGQLSVPRGKGSTRKVDIKFSKPVKAYKYIPMVVETEEHFQ